MPSPNHATGAGLASRTRARRRVMAGILVGVFAWASGVLFAAELQRWDGVRARGNPEAPVVLIEYSDFTCGYCQKFFRETWPRLKAEYVDTGRVLFVYRDYPRAAGGPGLEAAVAARCAGEQGKYWGMHDRLLEHGRFGPAAFEQHATAIGLDLQAFAACQRAGRYERDIVEEKVQALQLGFRGTPGFVLLRADRKAPGASETPLVGIPGALPFEVFAEQIERLLAEAS